MKPTMAILLSTAVFLGLAAWHGPSAAADEATPQAETKPRSKKDRLEAKLAKLSAKEAKAKAANRPNGDPRPGRPPVICRSGVTWTAPVANTLVDVDSSMLDNLDFVASASFDVCYAVVADDNYTAPATPPVFAIELTKGANNRWTGEAGVKSGLTGAKLLSDAMNHPGRIVLWFGIEDPCLNIDFEPPEEYERLYLVDPEGS